MKRNAMLLVATSVMALGAPSPAAADGAHDALARHAAYVGHPDSMVLTYRVVPAAKASPSPVPSQAGSSEPDFGPSEQAPDRLRLPTPLRLDVRLLALAAHPHAERALRRRFP
jgi:hypothetical protein